jgi:hypothetical protein
VPTLFEDVLDNDSDHSTSILLHSLTQVILDGPPTIMINETLCGTDSTERLDNPIQVDDNLIMMVMSSATTSNDLLPFDTTSDNSKLGPKSDHLLSTRRTVHFQDESNIPTVSILHDHPHINVTNVLLLILYTLSNISQS